MNATLLALDTSGASSSAAVLRGGHILAEATLINAGKQHCEGLMPMLDSCLNLAQVSPQQLDFIACTSGPGSFTGIRIGAAAAKGLAHAGNIGIIAVPTLDALAYNVFNASSFVAPVMDARRGQVYTALYRWEASQLARIGNYECMLLADVLEDLRNHGRNAVFAGDASQTFRDIITEQGHSVAPANQNHVRASSVGLLALSMLEDGYQPICYNTFTPFYLRKPQAERELEPQ